MWRQMSKSPSQIIEACGGPTKFAHLVGITPNAARVYKSRNRFPRTIWGHVVTALPDVTLEDLQRMEAA